MDWTPIVAGAAAGLGSGVIASLVAPWAQHAAETRRARQQRRSSQIADWRGMVSLYHGGGPHGGPYDMAKHKSWQSLRAQLSEAARVDIETLPPAQGATTIRQEHLRRIADEIDALEARWKL